MSDIVQPYGEALLRSAAMIPTSLNRLVKKGDTPAIREYFRANSSADGSAVNTADRKGITPLQHAVTNSNTDLEVVQILLAHGALISPPSEDPTNDGQAIISAAISAGDARKVAALIDAGADIKYRRSGGYDALLDSVHGPAVSDTRLLKLLQLLVHHGVELSGISSYQESGLRVLSRLGRFDAVRFLLQAGADERHLQWNPLHRAVAIGSTEEVESLVQNEARIEERDWWGRTAWLLAIQTGDIAKASALRDAGANTDARGRCGKPPLFYAIECRQPGMLRWLLDLGIDPEQTDEFGGTGLMEAVEADVDECAATLISAGALVDRINNGGTALRGVKSREMALRLLGAGADPAYLSSEGKRLLIGMSPSPDDDGLEDVSKDEFTRGRHHRFGTTNPEAIREPFWEAMIRSGINAYTAAQFFEGESWAPDGNPVWCAQRFGQSVTILPDGRAVLIGGEHEDHYDPDFCIYNDVIVHAPNGAIQVFGYSESTFQPTDFHTATLVGDSIYVIGCLGYGVTQISSTPIFRLDTRTLKIERLSASGISPGWIHKHRAVLISPHEIEISGGKIITAGNGEHKSDDNHSRTVLELDRLHWRTA